MKKLIGLLVLTVIILLTGCTEISTEAPTTSYTTEQIASSTTSQDTTNTILSSETITTSMPTTEYSTTTEVTSMTTTEQPIEYIALNQTQTINAEALYLNRDTFENLKYEDGLIKQVDYQLDGVYISKPYAIASFLELVPSWNVLIDESSRFILSISIGNEEGFSDFYLLGYWAGTSRMSFGTQEDEYGKVSIDTLISKKSDIKYLQIKAVIRSSSTENTALRNISITTKQTVRNMALDYSGLVESFNDVPPRQQMSIPEIGSRICSPTSLSMIMAYYGHEETPSEVAGLVYDSGASIYGNWSFNASYAGGFEELYSRVEYIDDIQVLNDYLLNGVPLALSIRTTSTANLQGSIVAYTSGHLVVIVGLKQVEGIWYAITNDPAEYSDEAVQREYLLDELMNAWRGYAYVIQTQELQ